MGLAALGSRVAGLRLERVRASPQYRDGEFRNAAPVATGMAMGAVMPFMAESLRGGTRRVPDAPLPSVSPLRGWSRPCETGLRATWLGHSTTLLEIDGARVLIDPVWGERASPVSFAGPRRFQPVPVSVEALPPLDAVVLSHDHFDHLDHPTIVQLARRDVPFVTSLGVGAHLEAWGVPASRIVELDWWERHELARTGLTITAAPAQHFSGRAPGVANPTLWSSMALRGAKHAAFFSGDTGLTTAFQALGARLGPFDLIMLEVGAYYAGWPDVHLGPENALTARSYLGGGALLPVHWGTFDLALHAWDEPAERLFELARRDSVPLVMPLLGEPVEPSRVERVDPWWRPTAPRR
ncbi:MAG: MBL fold metallo-hydrolase [Polyangiales bacterium]